MKERFYIINQVVPDLFATWQVLVVSGELNLAGGEDDEAKASLISHVLCQHLLLKLVRTLYLKAGLGIISVDTGSMQDVCGVVYEALAAAHRGIVDGAFCYCYYSCWVVSLG